MCPALSLPVPLGRLSQTPSSRGRLKRPTGHTFQTPYTPQPSSRWPSWRLTMFGKLAFTPFLSLNVPPKGVPSPSFLYHFLLLYSVSTFLPLDVNTESRRADRCLPDPYSYVPWYPYPHIAVAELVAPAAGSPTSWNFTYTQPMLEDFMAATHLRNHSTVINFSTQVWGERLSN